MPGANTPSVKVAVWQGPIPPPAILGQINEIIPDGADRVLKLAEASLHADIARERRGQWLAGAVSLAAIGGAVTSVALGASWQVSVAFLGLPILGIVKTLIGHSEAKPTKT
jgi:hypothetical protein